MQRPLPLSVKTDDISAYFGGIHGLAYLLAQRLIAQSNKPKQQGLNHSATVGIASPFTRCAPKTAQSPEPGCDADNGRSLCLPLAYPSV